MNECCKTEENLEVHKPKPDLTVRTCQVCGCRHIELEVDQAVFSFKGADI